MIKLVNVYHNWIANMIIVIHVYIYIYIYIYIVATSWYTSELGKTRHSRTLGQCLNATNSSGKNAYRMFLSIYKYRFNLAYVHNPRSTLIITLNNICIQSDVIVTCEKMHMILFFMRFTLTRHQIPPSSLRDTDRIRWLVPVKTHTSRKTIPYAYSPYVIIKLIRDTVFIVFIAILSMVGIR